MSGILGSGIVIVIVIVLHVFNMRQLSFVTERLQALQDYRRDCKDPYRHGGHNHGDER